MSDDEYRSIYFPVLGIPEPQGSNRAWVRGGRAFVTSSNKNLNGWRQSVGNQAQHAVELHNWALARRKDEAIELSIDFDFLKPASKSKKITRMTTRPDLDKLVRAVGDALTGIIYEDDSQVVLVRARKQYALATGATIEVVARGVKT